MANGTKKRKGSPGLSFVMLMIVIQKLHPMFKQLKRFNVGRVEKYIDDRGARKK